MTIVTRCIAALSAGLLALTAFATFSAPAAHAGEGDWPAPDVISGQAIPSGEGDWPAPNGEGDWPAPDGEGDWPAA